jgi:hypothetical protein
MSGKGKGGKAKGGGKGGAKGKEHAGLDEVSMTAENQQMIRALLAGEHGGDAESAKEGVDHSWECATCTFPNAVDSEYCEACGEEKPAIVDEDYTEGAGEEITEVSEAMVYHLTTALQFSREQARKAIRATCSTELSEVLDWLCLNLSHTELQQGFDTTHAQEGKGKGTGKGKGGYGKGSEGKGGKGPMDPARAMANKLQQQLHR